MPYSGASLYDCWALAYRLHVGGLFQCPFTDPAAPTFMPVRSASAKGEAVLRGDEATVDGFVDGLGADMPGAAFRPAAFEPAADVGW